jgi:hypothetical protein
VPVSKLYQFSYLDLLHLLFPLFLLSTPIMSDLPSNSEGTSSRPKGSELSIAQQGAIIALKTLIEAGTIKLKASEVASLFGVTPQATNQIFRTAKSRGFKSLEDLEDSHVASAARSGAPKKVTPEL